MVLTDLAHRCGRAIEREDNRPALLPGREVSRQEEAGHARTERRRQARPRSIECDAHRLQKVLWRRSPEGIDQVVNFERRDASLVEPDADPLPGRFEAADVRIEEDLEPTLPLERYHTLPVDRIGARQLPASIGEGHPVFFLDDELAVFGRRVATADAENVLP